MNTIIGSVVIFLIVVVILGLSAIHVYQRRTRRIARNLHQEQVKSTWVTMSLHRTVIDDKIPLPMTGGWSLSGDLLAYLSRQIVKDQPELVVELGSGLSTIILGYAIKKTGGRLVSVENDEEFYSETKRLVNAAGLKDYVTLIRAPLDNFDAHGKWYKKEFLAQLSGIDMLIIDGPSAVIYGEQVRHEALPYFWEKLNNSALVILDDAARSGEQKILEKWKALFPQIRVDILPFGHAPAQIIKISQ